MGDPKNKRHDCGFLAADSGKRPLLQFVIGTINKKLGTHRRAAARITRHAGSISRRHVRIA